MIEPVLTLMMAVSSLVVAGSALHVSSENGRAQRRHEVLSVKPLVYTWLECDTQKREVRYHIQNNGVGPAIITNVLFFSREGDSDMCSLEKLPVLLSEKIERFESRAKLNKIWLASSYALPPGGDLKLLTLHLHDHPLLRSEEVLRLSDEVKLKLSCSIEYQNIYGEVSTVVDP